MSYSKEKRQEILNIVSSHLLNQKQQSIYRAFCLYRNSYGLKCAIGALIPDNQYNPDFEETGLQQVLLQVPFLSDFDNDDYNFLQELQNIHDDTWQEKRITIPNTCQFDIEILKDQLQCFAGLYDLKVNFQ